MSLQPKTMLWCPFWSWDIIYLHGVSWKKNYQKSEPSPEAAHLDEIRIHSADVMGLSVTCKAIYNGCE